MKEMIVIKDTEQTFNIVVQFPTQVKPTDFEHTKEQVPENFSDLLTLCKNTKGCFVLRISNGEYIEVPTDLIGYSFTFYQDGRIFADEDVCVKEKATPQQMWQIIKSFIGEE